MMRIKYFSIVLLTFIAIISVDAQELHFSQFYLPTYTLNPALTGRMHEDVRVNVIHRSQWYKTGSNISTSGFGYDMNFEGGNLGDVKIGAGISALNDVLIKDFLDSKRLSLLGAIHMPLDAVKRQHLSFGLQAALSQMYVAGPENYLWGSEFDQFNRPQQLGNDQVGEDFSGGNNLSLSLNAGVAYDFYITKKLGIFYGASFKNINKPNTTFYGNIGRSDTSSTNIAMINMLKVQIALGQHFMLQPVLYYQNQTNAQSAIAGTFLTFIPNPDNHYLKLSLVPMYRFGASKTQNLSNAAILAGLIELHNFKIGLSYDMNLSSLNDVTSYPSVNASNVGTIEVSITYLGQLLRANPNDLTIPCKFF